MCPAKVKSAFGVETVMGDADDANEPIRESVMLSEAVVPTCRDDRFAQHDKEFSDRLNVQDETARGNGVME